MTLELFEGHISGRSDVDVACSFFSSTATPKLVAELGRQKDAYMSSHLHDVQLITGAVEFLQQLRWAGHLVAVVTNSNRTTAEALLKHHGFAYELLVVGNECARLKPYAATRHPFTTLEGLLT